MHEVFLAEQTVARGQIDRPTLRAMRQAQAPDYVLTGMVDELAPACGDLTVTAPSGAVGLRLLSAEDGRLLAAWELQRSGDDGEGMLGYGRIHSLGRLAGSLASDLVKRLGDQLGDYPTQRNAHR